MRKRTHPASVPGTLVVDGVETVCLPPCGGATEFVWIARRPALLASTVLCRAGRLHVTRNGGRSLCGEQVDRAGWVRASGTWCGQGVVRCRHCEKAIARLMGEPAARSKS